MADDFRILFVADVVGQPGRDAVKAILPELERVLRPANYPPKAPGQGWCVVQAAGHDVLVMNLMGRIFTMDTLDDPFRAADAILAAHPQAKIVFCDMHAEATTEKTAMGWYRHACRRRRS